MELDIAGSNWAVERPEGAPYVRIVFPEHVTLEIGVASSERCRALFGDERLHIVGDFPKFRSYDTEARLAWQKTLLPIRKQVKSILVLNENPIARMGVQVFGMAVRVPVKAVRERDAFERAVSALD